MNFDGERCGEQIKLADMSYITGEAREQVTMLPLTLDEFIPADHLCGVIEAFVDRLEMQELGFVRAEPAETGRPGYDPRDLLKLYVYGYMNQLRSSRRLEAECQRNVEVMWLLGRLQPDYKSIAEFRRMHGEAVKQAGGELVGLAREAGLVRGEWVAIDGSKFRAVSSAARVKERAAIERYLQEMEEADANEDVVIDHSAMQAALEKLRQDPEPEARFMRTTEGKRPAYNVQAAVDRRQGNHRGPGSNVGDHGQSKSAGDGGSGTAGGRLAGDIACSGRCRLLEWRTGSRVRRARNRAARARQSRNQHT